MSVDTTSILVCLILLFPLGGCVANGLLGPRLGRRFVNLAGTLSIFAAFVVAILLLANVVGAPAGQGSISIRLWQWLDLGTNNLSVGMDFTVDPLSVVMIMVITGVGFLIHWWAVGYMEHDPGVARFFSYMNLFVFSMLTLVLAADLVILIIGWALVALSSYLLIAFWYERPSAVLAARKAFITQVIGDVAMVIAAFLLFLNAHTLSLPNIFARTGVFASGGILITGICVLLAIGAFAKSAQFPLHTWLPDAMEGPTPVSALIHAATMVTAGVYLIARFHPLFNLAPVAGGMVACVGIGTALMAGIIALSQVGIKRVIAYSTMSQIGLMIYAVGIGAYGAGMFHFVTHAVFKALLFMAAGNVIHALHDEQDIRLMGGVAARMKWTHWSFLAGSFALAGIPIFSGWFSKENLLGFGTVAGPGGAPWILYLVGIAINVLTGVYAFRLWAVVFHGEPQTARVWAAKESRLVMLVPVVILGVLSVIVAWPLQWPFPGAPVSLFSSFLAPVFAGTPGGAAEPGLGVATIALIAGTLCSMFGVGLAVRLWLQGRPEPAVVIQRIPRELVLLSHNKFYFDEIYDRALVQPTRAVGRTLRRVVEPNVMDGWIRGLGSLMRGFSVDLRSYQTGYIRDYASLFAVFAVIFVIVTVVFVAR
ncbi:MAG: NADH-quinone oxidoreductase subunit L [Candidatus Dormibacteraeota bacterium]|nr:NADH-quinone oxidoreductase subunit L [Candidatus Dormibacteraeota bacterium]